MISSTLNSLVKSGFSGIRGRLFTLLSGMVLSVIALTVFQDFLESKRSGYLFHFSESLLFKTVWLLYIPIVMVIYQQLKNGNLKSLIRVTGLVIFSVVAHILLFSGIATVLALLFYPGNYDLFKFFSYTVTHDAYLIILIYTGFVSGYRYFSNRKQEVLPHGTTQLLHSLIINNGKDNVIISVKDIIQITSATPYVCIHLEHKKYLHTETLKSIQQQLGEDVFVRVHKSALINMSKVISFKSRLNGDYDLQMTDGSTVRLSRTYAADFRKRISVKSTGQLINSSG